MSIVYVCLCYIASHAKLLKRMLNALGRRKAGEGEKILPFTSCTTQCAAGYTQSVRYLTLVSQSCLMLLAHLMFVSLKGIILFGYIISKLWKSIIYNIVTS